MSPTKADIDALVDGLVPSRIWPGSVKLDSKPAGWIKDADELKCQLYISAGLTAEGERRPERVKCYLYRHAGQDDPRGITIGNPPQGSLKPNGWEVTPGWFVPDGAE